MFGDRYSLVPVGWYSFLPATDADAQPESGERDADLKARRRVTILVYEHDRAGFDRMRDHVASGGRLNGDGAALQQRFFANTAEPRPTVDQLALIADYVHAHKTMPPVAFLDARADLDPRKLAQRIVDQDLRPEEACRGYYKTHYDSAPGLVDAVWGGPAGFCRGTR